MKKKTLMVDMDNVITDGIFFELIQEFLGKKINRNEVKTYYLQELIEEQKEEFWNKVKDRDFYEGAPLLDNCYEVLKELNEKYDIYIVTSYLWKDVIDISGKTLNDKYYYLRRMLPFIEPEKYIFANNKNLFNFDVKIDDRLCNLEGAKIKILFDAWHNREINDKELEDKGIYRVNNWLEILNILNNND